jgi:hypothetical protein
VRYSEGFVTPLFIGGLVILGAWLAIALLEILAPGPAIRWRRRILERRGHRFGSAQIAAAFNHITHERDDPDGWRDPSVQQRVRMIGLVNFALAVLFGLFLVLARR